MALEAESETLLDERDIMNAIWDMVYQLYGEFGASQTALHKVSWDDERKTLTIRCSHKMLEMVRAAVTALTEINEKSAAIRVVAVSGTLKALKKKTQRQQT
ncbi:MAG: Rpp14/Pop5 family protein [Candidatus Bathyarchaeia archaeon]